MPPVMKDHDAHSGLGLLSYRPSLLNAWKSKEHDNTAASVKSEDVSVPDSGKGISLHCSNPTEIDSLTSSDEPEVHYRTDFVLECNGGESIFVTSAQGKVVQSRCFYFRDRFHADATERIIKKPEWSVATARRLIELLSTGFTWIENDASTFSELVEAAEQVSVELRLGSLINYHDTLGKEATQKFFKMINIEKYQFKLQATIKSSQWSELIRRGILLLLKAKVIMVKAAHTSPVESHSIKGPSQDRLNKCDSISSEFCVYANGKVDVLLNMANVLSLGLNPIEAKSRPIPQEEYRISYLATVGSLSQEQTDMLWRITAASYTATSPEHRKYLAMHERLDDVINRRKASCVGYHCVGMSPDSEKDENGSVSTDQSICSSPVGVADVNTSDAKVMVGSNKAFIMPCDAKTVHTIENSDLEFECRTITCNSFLVLKHIFETINEDDEDLPACLIITAPTPDSGKGISLHCSNPTEIDSLTSCGTRTRGLSFQWCALS